MFYVFVSVMGLPVASSVMASYRWRAATFSGQDTPREKSADMNRTSPADASIQGPEYMLSEKAGLRACSTVLEAVVELNGADGGKICKEHPGQAAIEAPEGQLHREFAFPVGTMKCRATNMKKPWRAFRTRP